SVQTLADQIAAADAVIISTPEYNKLMSGALKNALDWVSRTKGGPWKGKPVAIMSAAAGRAGGERGQWTLRLALNPFGPRVIAGPEFHLAASYEQFDEEGGLKGELYQKTMNDLMAALRAEIG
ncbi:MAG: NAD(P)H-dependent oxidoreductase, partial [Pseudomonadota bacterium]